MKYHDLQMVSLRESTNPNTQTVSKIKEDSDEVKT